MSTPTWTKELQDILQFKIHSDDFIRKGDAAATIEAWVTLAKKQNRSLEEIDKVARLAAEGNFDYTVAVLSWVTDANAANPLYANRS